MFDESQFATCHICGDKWQGLHNCPATENEHEYLGLLEKIVRTGTIKKNRTGVDTIGILGTQSRYDLRKGFPLFTTKKVWFKGVVHELLWFLSGSTNIKYLVDNGVNIWNDDAYRHYTKDMDDEWKPSKEYFVQKIKLGHTDPGLGELGPVYGSQWRAWGEPVADALANLAGEKSSGGIDQIANLVDGLKNNPDSRRHILSAWNVDEVPFMGLPPCHVMSMWSVVNKKLYCNMIQRSMDTALGCPFNVASYALLTHMLAQVCGYGVGEFVHWSWDSHIYVNQIDGIKEQLTRQPRAAPKLWLNPAIKNIDDFKFEDIKIENYNPHSKISMPLSTDDITK
jgi:thymidylate synthase